MEKTLERALRRSRRFYRQALEFAHTHPDISLWRCRKTAEVILLQNHRSEVGEPGEKVARSLNELIEEGRKHDIISKLQQVNLQTIQQYGNFGSHNQGGEEDDLSYQEILPCLTATESLMQWWDPSFDPKVHSVVDQTEELEAAVQVLTGTPKTIRQQMWKMADEMRMMQGGEVSLRQMVGWFGENYPNYQRSAVEAHVAMMTTNGEARLHHKLKTDGSDELFFRISPGVYRTYRKGDDPPPIMEVEQNSGWEEKLIVVNCRESLQAVSTSRVYMAPHKGGNYKIHRARYFGLYSHKNVSQLAEVLAKVTFRRKTSKGYVWWKLYDELDNNELKEIARREVDARLDFDYPVQVYVLGEFADMDFRKDTKHGLARNNKVFDISDLDHDSTEVLAEELSKRVWSDF